VESLILEIQTILETKYNLLKTCESFLSEKSMSEPEVLMEALEAEIKAIRIQDLLFLSRYEQILNQFGVSTLEELPESVRLEMQH
jgi:hypothetical protein